MSGRKLSAGDAFSIEDALLGLCFIFLFLRLYVRTWLQARFDATDVFIIAAFLNFAAFCIINRIMWKHGIQVFVEVFTGDLSTFRQDFGDDAKLVRLLKMIYASAAPYWNAIFFVKFAFLRLYYRLIIPTMTKLRLCLNIITVMTVLSYILSLGVNFFWCLPLSKNWSLVFDEGMCWNFFAVEPYFICTIGDVVTDLLIYGLPFFLLPSLRVSPLPTQTSSLLPLILMFSLGFICITITIVRSAVAGTNIWLPLLYVLFVTELASAIIVACCPPLKWLWRSWRVYGYKAKRGTFADRYPNWERVDLEDYGERIEERRARDEEVENSREDMTDVGNR